MRVEGRPGRGGEAGEGRGGRGGDLRGDLRGDLQRDSLRQAGQRQGDGPTDGRRAVCVCVSGACLGRVWVRVWGVCVSVGTEDIPHVLVGNKNDLVHEREVATEEGQRLADEWGVPFIESSAKYNTNVEEVFRKLIATCETRSEVIRSIHACVTCMLTQQAYMLALHTCLLNKHTCLRYMHAYLTRMRAYLTQLISC